ARLDQLIEQAIAAGDRIPEQDQRRKDLLDQRRKAQDELGAFAAHLEKTYGPAAGEIFTRERVQKALPPDAALVGWLDIFGRTSAADPDGERWAVVLRSAGPPAWVRLRGTGPRGAWTEADNRVADELWAALPSPRSDWEPLARRLRAQRLEPLAKHLAATERLPAVRRLILLPSPLSPATPPPAF